MKINEPIFMLTQCTKVGKLHNLKSYWMSGPSPC